MIYDEYTVRVKRIPEHIVPDKRLGRHVRHDSRSLAYRYRTAQPDAALKTTLIERYIPILNQGQTSSCTLNAGVGAVGTGANFLALTVANQQSLNEQEALYLYSDEEIQLGFGPYPPNDNGGDGLTAASVLQKNGYISGYTHCLQLSDVLEAINDEKPVMLGTNWYDSFDAPDSNGNVQIAPNAVIRGGHEYLARGINVEDQLVFCDNSWSSGWGMSGSFTLSWDTLTALLAQSGDGTVVAALNEPKPVPVGIVGEHGPEMINISGGSTVMPI